MSNEHIQDPTIKVKAPTSMLNALGNCYVNLSLSAHGLDQLLVLLTGEPWEDYEYKQQPTTVMDYVKACQELSYHICDTKDKLHKFVGNFEWDEGGELVRLT